MDGNRNNEIIEREIRNYGRSIISKLVDTEGYGVVTPAINGEMLLQTRNPFDYDIIVEGFEI